MKPQIQHPTHCPECGNKMHLLVQDAPQLRERYYMAHCVTLGCTKFYMTFTYHVERGDDYDADLPVAIPA